MASFIFFDDYATALSELSDKSRLKVYDALCDYAFRQIEPDLHGESKAVFALIKREIDGYNKRVENGKKGGRKKSIVKPHLNQGLTTPNEKNNQGSSMVLRESPDKRIPPNEKERSKEKENISPQENYPQENHITAGACACVESDGEMSCADFLARYPNVEVDTNIAAYGLDWDLLDQKFQESKNYLQGRPHTLSWIKRAYSEILKDKYKDKRSLKDVTEIDMGYNGMGFFDRITESLKAKEEGKHDG